MTMRAGYAVGLVGLVGLAGACWSGCSSSSAGSGPASDDGGADGALPTLDAEVSDASQPVTKTVGASGGTIAATGVTLTIPAGALSADTPITIMTAATAPAGYTTLSPVFVLAPNGVELLTPATLTITLTSQGVNPTVFLSDDSGSFDALATTVTGTTVSASIDNLGTCFAGTSIASDDAAAGEAGSGGDDASASDGATPATDAGASDAQTSEASTSEAGASDAATVETGAGEGGAADAGDAGFVGIMATVDSVVTTFDSNASIVDQNSVWRIQGDDNATTTHWTLQIMVGTTPQEVCSSSLADPAITYTHYTSGTADSVYSTAQGGSCTTTSFAPAAQGDYGRGTFSGAVDLPQDAGGGSHSLASGSWNLLY